MWCKCQLTKVSSKVIYPTRRACFHVDFTATYTELTPNQMLGVSQGYAQRMPVVCLGEWGWTLLDLTDTKFGHALSISGIHFDPRSFSVIMNKGQGYTKCLLGDNDSKDRQKLAVREPSLIQPFSKLYRTQSYDVFNTGPCAVQFAKKWIVA